MIGGWLPWKLSIGTPLKISMTNSKNLVVKGRKIGDYTSQSKKVFIISDYKDPY